MIQRLCAEYRRSLGRSEASASDIENRNNLIQRIAAIPPTTGSDLIAQIDLVLLHCGIPASEMPTDRLLNAVLQGAIEYVSGGRGKLTHVA